MIVTPLPAVWTPFRGRTWMLSCEGGEFARYGPAGPEASFGSTPLVTPSAQLPGSAMFPPENWRMYVFPDRSAYAAIGVPPTEARLPE